MKKTLALLLFLLLAMPCVSLAEEDAAVFPSPVFYYEANFNFLHSDLNCPLAADVDSPLVPLTEAEARNPRYGGTGACPVCGKEKPEADSLAFALLSVQEKAEKGGYALPGETETDPEALLNQLKPILMTQMGMTRSQAVQAVYMVYYYPDSSQWNCPCYDVTLLWETCDNPENGYRLETMAYIRLNAENLQVLDAVWSPAWRSAHEMNR